MLVLAEAMKEKEFQTEFDSDVLAQVEELKEKIENTTTEQWLADGVTQDLRSELFMSIDNDDTRSVSII